jgi:hypothetical protein
MPRISRIVIAGYPHHIIQRGHNRQAVFVTDGDFLYYLENLREWKDAYGCRIYAYCLMTNHVHLKRKSKDGRNFEGREDREKWENKSVPFLLFLLDIFACKFNSEKA